MPLFAAGCVLSHGFFGARGHLFYAAPRMEEPAPLGGRRLWVFRAVAISLPLLGVLCVELALRFLQPSFDPYLEVKNRTTIFSEVEIDGTRYMRVSHPEAYSARDTKFSIEKPPGTLRIFSLGGSASAGWPHPDEEIYTEYLRHALELAYPEQKIEVINLGAHAFASYRVRMIFDDVLEYEPDLMIIYSGNNDFLERRSYLLESPWRRGLERVARHSRLVHLVSRTLNREDHDENAIDGRSAWGHHQGAVWDWVRQTSIELRTDPEQCEGVKEHYASSIGHMVNRSAAEDIPVLLVTVPSNLRNWKPNASHNALQGEALASWRKPYQRALRARLEGNADEALRAFDESVELEPIHAESYYRRAQVYEEMERYDRANQDYLRAKDLDHNPFRAISDFNHTLRRIADEEDGAFLVEAEQAFARASEHGSPGFDLFLDYVHPTRVGNLLLATVTFDAILRDDVFGLKPATTTFTSPPDSGYDELRDVRMQTVLLWILGMNRQEESMLAKAELLLDLSHAGFPDAKQTEVDQLLAFIAEIQAALPPLVELRRRDLLGIEVPASERKRVSDQADAFFVRHYGGETRPWTRPPPPAPH
jgi:tetratricopeptide (TPR) repeat protein